MGTTLDAWHATAALLDAWHAIAELVTIHAGAGPLRVLPGYSGAALT